MTAIDVEAPTVLNGWDVDEMQAAVKGVADNPEAGPLTWRSRVVWDAGFGLDVRTEELEQLGEAVPRPFTLRGDHPPMLLGHNSGPTAVEALLAALGSCITGTYAAQATARGVKIDRLEVELETTNDLNGFFGLTDVRAGLQGVTARFHVVSDADDATLDELRDAVTRLSPVYDSLTRPVEIDMTVERG